MLGSCSALEALLLNTQNLQYDLKQKVVETENRIHILVGQYSTTLARNTSGFMASAMQVQSVYQYEQTVLQAYTDVLNQLTKLDNYSNSFKTKQGEVELLTESVAIANSLFQYAKADYVEVLLTQEEVLNAKMELVETKLQQLQAKVEIYRALGGGWH